MAGFIYLLRRPDSPPKDVSSPLVTQALEEAGLEHVCGMRFSLDSLKAFDENCWMFLPRGYGDGAKQSRPLVTPEKQTWRSFTKFHVGFNNDDKPSPNDLARSRQFATQTLLLGGTGGWRIPVIPIDAAGHLHDDDLPREFDVDDSGKPILKIESFYSPLESLVGRYWDYQKVIQPLGQQLSDLRTKVDSLESAFQTESDEIKKQAIAAEQVIFSRQIDDIAEQINKCGPSAEDRAMDCVMVLSRNYHVGPVEVGMLKLLNSQTISAIIFYAFLDKAAIDLERLAEKKG